jgi:hypothetical protein
MVIKCSTFILALLFCFYSKLLIAAPHMVIMSELDFSLFLPITGSCEIDVETGIVSSLPGSQMCISSGEGSIAHYRLMAFPNTNYSIQVNTRLPEGGDGLTFTPVGKLTSDVDDIVIVPGQVHIVNSGALSRIDIKFGGQIILSNTSFSPDLTHEIEMEAAIVWSAVP